RGAHQLRRPLLPHEGRDRQSEAAPEALPAHLDRCLRRDHDPAGGALRRRVERRRRRSAADERAQREARAGVRRGRPRRLRDPPLGPVRLGREERRRAHRTVGRFSRARHHRAGDLPARSWSRAGGACGEARGVASGPAPQSKRRVQHTQEVAMADSVYRVTELVGTSSTSWEAAAKSAIETAAKSLRDLRVAEVVRQDVTIENGKVSTYRVRLNVSFKYEGAPTA